MVPVEYFVRLLKKKLESVDAVRLTLSESSEKFKLLPIVCLTSVKLKIYDIESISSSIKLWDEAASRVKLILRGDQVVYCLAPCANIVSNFPFIFGLQR